ncbi:uncharacterized protein ARMOST_20088 [Armillaria ostoyae]|uniref:Uncharacterized protein n=1 Tax=Armillaria ostoyae TaxID=47428 RepID=A0A284S6C3_ARMOS|nr:uncharacterized protein ARMOST_20088 [Armillaria ostoyae]
MSTNYLLLRKHGHVARSTLLFPSNFNGPVIQALNANRLPYPMPAAIHMEPMESTVKTVDLNLDQLDAWIVDASQLARPVEVSVTHWHHIYGAREGSKGEWGYDWHQQERYEVIDNGRGKFMLEHTQAKEIASNLQLISVRPCLTRDLYKDIA